MKEILKYYVRLMMLVLPVFFLPVVTDPLGMGKSWMLLMSALLGMVIFVIDLWVGKKDGFKVNKIWWWVVAIVVWAWIGWWRLPVGIRMRSFGDLAGVGTLTGLAGWLFLWMQVKSKEESKIQLNYLTAAGVIIAISSIIVFVIPATKLPWLWPKNNPLLVISTNWTLAGSVLAEAWLMLFLLIEWVKRLTEKLKKEGGGIDYVVEAVMAGLWVLVMALDIYRLFKIGWVNLDGASAWVIAVEVFKRNPLWGIGIGNFWEAFNRFRPESYNLTNFWSVVFKSSSSGGLQLWTELGLIGVALTAIAASKLVSQKKDFNFFRLVIFGIMALCLPFNLMGLILLMWLTANTVFEEKKTALMLKIGEGGINVMPWLMGTVMVAMSIFGGYWMVRVLAGEIYMRNSLVAASKNDGGTTYNLQIKAISWNPYLADYRRVYSQTNLVLAQTLLANKDISDDDKQKVSVLVQQSVREAKAAIGLDNLNPNYWTNLAVIYKQLINLVEGAADWSFQAYQQTVAFDPSNPLLRLDLGGLLYAAGRYEEADRIFEQVVTLKQDYANGWYNWAYTAKQTGKLAEAVQRLSQALALVPVDSGDYDKASKELAGWKKELDELMAKQQQIQQQAKEAETLKTPEPLPTVNKPEKVKVPTGELEPPAPKVVGETGTSEVTPELTPTPTKAVATPTK